MKILMIGLGSIGQRHLRNIRKLYGDEPEILAYRVRRLQQTFSDDMKIRDGVNLEDEFNIRVYSDLDEALLERPQVAFITNITAKHMECAIRAAKAGCNLFLEKPISDSMDLISELRKVIEDKQLIVYVGYQNRLHPCIKDVKNYLESGKIGRLISVDNEFSERLVTMHTYEDYSKTYMARKEMGGGPILNLQIHCLDYLQMLFGVPESVYSVAGSNSGLDIDVEDFASSLYSFGQNEGGILPVYAHTDFLQYPPVHKIKIVGEKGRIEADLNQAASKQIVDGLTVSENEHKDFIRNNMFIEELSEFFNCVNERKRPDSDFEQGIIGLKMALAAKKSAEEKRKVFLEEIV